MSDMQNKDRENSTTDAVEAADAAGAGDADKGKKKGVAFFNKRWFRYGGFSALVIAGVFVLVVLLNVGFAAAEKNWAWKIDLTQSKLYSLSDEAKEMLATVKEDVCIYAIVRNENVPELIDGPVVNMVATNPHLSYRVVDPVLQPDEVRRFVVNGTTVGENTVVVENTKTKVYKVADLSNVYSYQTNFLTGEEYFAGIQMEQIIANAIVYVTQEDPIDLYFLTGHGEQSMANFSKLTTVWEGFGIQASQKNLLVDEVELKHGDIVFLAAPQLDISDAEREKLKEFILAGGSIIYITDPILKVELPHIDSLLALYGIAMDPRMVSEKDTGHYQANPLLLRPTIATHDITSKLTAAGRKVLLAQAEGITLPELPKGMIEVTPLLLSSNNISLASGETSQDSTTPVPLAVSVRLHNDKGDSDLDGRSVIIGDAEMLMDTLTQTEPANAEFAQGMFQWIVARNDSIYIPPKLPSSTVLNIPDATTSYILAALVAGVMPLVLFIGGFVVWQRRKHL